MHWDFICEKVFKNGMRMIAINAELNMQSPWNHNTIQDSKTLGLYSFLETAIFSAIRVEHLGHLHAGAARTREGLNSHDLEVEVAISKSVLRPIVEMVANSDSTGSTLALPNGPVLRERARPCDRWLIGSCVGANGICAAV